MWNIIPEEQEKLFSGWISSRESRASKFYHFCWLLSKVFPFYIFRNIKYAHEPSFDKSLCLACEYSRFTLALFFSTGDVLFENSHIFLKFSEQCSMSLVTWLTTFNTGNYAQIISRQSGWNALLKTNLTGVPGLISPFPPSFPPSYFFLALFHCTALHCPNGVTQYCNTIRKSGKYQNTVQKIGEVPIPHLWSVTSRV